MRFPWIKRAHETLEHVNTKRVLADLLRSCGWIVLVEALYVDLAALNVKVGLLWALEVERSLKLVRHNAQKAFACGADRLLIVACDASLAAKSKRIITDMTDICPHTLVVTPNQVNEEFVHEVMEKQ